MLYLKRKILDSFVDLVIHLNVMTYRTENLGSPGLEVATG